MTTDETETVPDFRRREGCFRIIRGAGRYKREMALWPIGAICELADELIYKHTITKVR